MRRIRIAASLLAIVALGLFGAGCGDDDDSGDSGDSGGDALTKAEFVKQGNAICTEGNAEINEGFAALGPQPSEAKQQEFILDTLVPNAQGQLDQIGELTPPEGDEDEIDAILAAGEEGLTKVEEEPAALYRSGSADPFNEFSQLAGDYGLTVCAAG